LKMWTELRGINFAAHESRARFRALRDCFFVEVASQKMLKAGTVEGRACGDATFLRMRAFSLCRTFRFSLLLIQGTFAHMVIREHRAAPLGKESSRLTLDASLMVCVRSICMASASAFAKTLTAHRARARLLVCASPSGGGQPRDGDQPQHVV
jgi:hypothetical protein